MPPETEPVKKRAPALIAIIFFKMAKGLLLLTAAIIAYTLSDNDLIKEFNHLLHILGLNPGRHVFVRLAKQIGNITETNLLWAAAGTLVYSLFSLCEGIGLAFRVGWAGWLAVAEGAFLIPVELYEMRKGFSWTVLIILIVNILIVWYLVVNRHRLFKHHVHVEKTD